VTESTNSPALAASEPRPAPWRRWVFVGAVVAMLGASAIFRWKVQETWHVPGGDGLNYYSLSQELIAHGRFSFGPPPTALSFTRLPGYPIFLAYAAIRVPMDREHNWIRAAHTNLFLDLGTALLVLLILRERKLGGRLTQAAGVLGVLICPLIMLLSCYCLTETLATFLATLEIWLALRAMRTRTILYAALCGAVAGYAQLVRADAITVAPAVGLALLWSDVPKKKRLIAMAVGALVASAIFLPWPIRNLHNFGKPYFAATYWRDLNGNALPDEPIAWERTWGSGAEGEDILDLFFYFNHPFVGDGSNIFKPQMFDDEAEHQRVIALFRRYHKEKWTPWVKNEFVEIARERTRRHPLRTYLTLPLKRIAKLWSPVPEWELPMRTKLLDLPNRRPTFGVFDKGLYLLALIGAIALWLRGRGSPERRTIVLLVSCLIVRTLIYGFASPIGVTERYLIEAYPILLVLAAVAVTVTLPSLAMRARARFRRRS
jgi:4-amino-4-deoxy-L-arabinose transferase-like glycosyltransferase